MVALASFVCGLIFGFGLLISGMTQPAKVLGFLDIFGRWDPTLAFVMAAALMVSGIGFSLVRQRRQPVLAAQYLWPTRTDIDRPLVVCFFCFGVGGWLWWAPPRLVPVGLVRLVVLVVVVGGAGVAGGGVGGVGGPPPPARGGGALAPPPPPPPTIRRGGVFGGGEILPTPPKTPPTPSPPPPPPSPPPSNFPLLPKAQPPEGGGVFLFGGPPGAAPLSTGHRWRGSPPA